ncbi:hypothetical protein ISTM_155 [Insectomime virus]|nr:hypothetical protein ISTM_155 [Insectomime virus]
MLFVQKQPLNPIEGPIQPCIKRDPPRFVEAGKHWTANPGDIILDNATNPYLIDGTILAVARDRNKTQYGQKSYTFKVNKAFRPPLIDRDDLVPLSRLPRPTTQYRNNPSIPFQTMNPMSMEGRNYVKQQRCADNILPSFFHRVDQPQPDVVINLQQKLPSVSVETPKSFGLHLPTEGCTDPNIRKIGWEVTLRNKKAVEAKSNPSFSIGVQSQHNDVSLSEHNPKVFADAGRTFCLRNNNSSQQDISLQKRNPSVYADSKKEWFVHFNAEQPDIELDLHNPSVFANAGHSSMLRHTNTVEKDISLERKNPLVFAHAKKEYAVNLNDVSNTKDIFLEQKRPNASASSGRAQNIETIQDRNIELKQRVIHTNTGTGRRAMEFGNPEHSKKEAPRIANRVQTSASSGMENMVKETIRNEDIFLKQTLTPNKGDTYTSNSAMPVFCEKRPDVRIKSKERLRPASSGNWS